MSEAKFTKGPWMADVRIGCVGVYQSCREDEYPSLSGNDGRSIFFKSGFKDERDEWCVDDVDVANANLIAAAPEMYAILGDVYDGLLDAGGRGNIALAKSIAALLAKARGEKEANK